MKPKALLLICFLASTALHAQSVENVSASSDGNLITINYTLNNPAPQNYIRLKYSKDNGISFSQDLQFVTGDVGEIQTAGNKSIVWDAEKEIGSYSGELQFKVIADSKTQKDAEDELLTKAERNIINEDSFSFEIISCKREDSKIVVVAKVVAKVNAEFNFYFPLTPVTITDKDDIAYSSKKGTRFITKGGTYKFLSTRMSELVEIEFYNISSSTNLIKSISIPIRVWPDSKNSRLLVFENVTIQ